MSLINSREWLILVLKQMCFRLYIRTLDRKTHIDLSLLLTILIVPDRLKAKILHSDR